jgi:hypothetical protein
VVYIGVGSLDGEGTASHMHTLACLGIYGPGVLLCLSVIPGWVRMRMHLHRLESASIDVSEKRKSYMPRSSSSSSALYTDHPALSYT